MPFFPLNFMLGLDTKEISVQHIFFPGVINNFPVSVYQTANEACYLLVYMHKALLKTPIQIFCDNTIA